MVNPKYIKILKGLLVVIYAVQYAPVVLLQTASIPICIAYFFVSGTEQHVLDIVINAISLVQYIYLLLFTLITIAVIIAITSLLTRILWKHYQCAKSSNREKDSLYCEKVKNMKYALFNVIFFMVGITCTLLLKCIVSLLFIVASFLEVLSIENGRILFILGNVGSIFVVYGLLIVAIVLYSPRSFKSLQQSAEVLLEKMGKYFPKKEREEIQSVASESPKDSSIASTEVNLGAVTSTPSVFQNTL